jgi:hypothetical protein
MDDLKKMSDGIGVSDPLASKNGSQLSTEKSFESLQKPSRVLISRFNAGPIVINIHYYEGLLLYKALIHKKGEYYLPKVSTLQAKSFDLLCQQLRIEYREESLQYFVGFECRHAFQKLIETMPDEFKDYI